jgi:hypothetical protein
VNEVACEDWHEKLFSVSGKGGSIMGKATAFIASMVLLSIGFFGCESQKGPEPTDVRGPKIGTAVEIGDTSIEVVAFVPSRGNETFRTKLGRIWALVKMEIVNGGSKPLEIDPADFSVVASEGEISKAREVNFVFDPITKITLAPGEKIKGKLAFNAPDKDPLLKLKWKPQGTDSECVINLVKEEEE